VAAPGKRFLRLRTERGAAAVEFGLIMPILLLLAFGIIQYGFYFWAMQGASDIARDAARRAAVADQTVVSCGSFTNTVRGKINDFVGSGRVVRLSRSFIQNTALARTNASDVVVGDRVQVVVKFKGYDFHLPFVPFIHDAVVTSTVDARVEYVTTQPGLTCTSAT
jgi:Flp pilus assembly protein TadG